MRLETIKLILVNAHGCYNWQPYYSIIPRKTITGKWVWKRKIYKRKVRFIFASYLFPLDMSPIKDIVQYGTIFDVLNNVYQQFEKS
jgi:hypothetical protein